MAKLALVAPLIILAVALGCGGSSDPSPPAVKRVFVTSTGYDGFQVTPAFADGVCTSSAAGANLKGTWKA